MNWFSQTVEPCPRFAHQLVYDDNAKVNMYNRESYISRGYIVAQVNNLNNFSCITYLAEILGEPRIQNYVSCNLQLD